MSDTIRLRLVEKARRGNETHDARQLLYRYACDLSSLSSENAAVERNQCQYLKFAEPFQTSKKLDLRRLLKNYLDTGTRHST